MYALCCYQEDEKVVLLTNSILFVFFLLLHLLYPWSFVAHHSAHAFKTSVALKQKNRHRYCSRFLPFLFLSVCLLLLLSSAHETGSPHYLPLISALRYKQRYAPSYSRTGSWIKFYPVNSFVIVMDWDSFELSTAKPMTK